MSSDLPHKLKYIAPAKVNLCLDIGARQDDGYHPLTSIVGFTKFGDSLSIESSNQDELKLIGRFSDKIDTNISDNLVTKTLDILRKKYNSIPPLKIVIDKQIPVGGGLGGGSTDAATTFLALNEIFSLDISLSNLEKLAIKIGADVPVCLHRGFVKMEGIGNVITPMPDTKLAKYIVLAHAGCVANTREVFNKFDKNSASKVSLLNQNPNDIDQLLNGGNKLQVPATEIYPEIALLLKKMQTLYPGELKKGTSTIQMSGSGASCFALFDDSDMATAFCLQLRKAGYWSVSTEFMINF